VSKWTDYNGPIGKEEAEEFNCYAQTYVWRHMLGSVMMPAKETAIEVKSWLEPFKR